MAISSTHRAASRTVRPSGVSALASTSVMSRLTTRGSRAGGACGGAQLTCADPAGHGRRARRGHGAVADVDIEVHVDAPRRATPGDLQGLGHRVGHRTALELLPADHGDPELSGACGVEGRVGEVADPDLDDAPAVEAGLDQPAHRRAVRAPVAQVVVGIEGDQAVGEGAVGHGERDGVVPTQGKHRRPREQPDRLDRCALARGGVRVGLVAEVDEHQLGQVEIRRRNVGGVARQRRADGGRRGVGAGGRDRGGVRRDADQGHLDRSWGAIVGPGVLVGAGLDPGRGPRPVRVVSHGSSTLVRRPIWWLPRALACPARHTPATRSTPGR